MDFSTCPDDILFGPTVDHDCRGDFDFTIKFEKIFFSLIPASIFVALSLTRVLYLTRQATVVAGTWFKYAKLAVAFVYAALQLALLVLSAAKSRRLESFFISSAAVTLASSLCMVPLSALEHSRSLRPSIIFNSYLFLTLLFDIIVTRTLWLASRSLYELTFTRLFTCSLAIKVVMLLFESAQKTRWLISWDVKAHSPEETAGVFGLGAFVWLNRLFLAGYQKVLTMDDLFPLDHGMISEKLHAEATQYLHPESFRGDNHALSKALAKALAVPLLLPVAPRIALLAFTFCQPFLIQSLLEYLQLPKENASPNHGYGLIGATALIYTGMAFSGTFYWYYAMRSMYMVRGIVASAVYRKTTETKIAVSDDSAALTLMSGDVERMIRGWQYMHEFWCNTIEAALALWLLSRHLGAASVAPLVVVVLSGICTASIANLVGPKQKAWMEKIQKRVGLTANVIGNMKQLKISGLAGPVEDSIQAMRVDELKTGNKFRRILIYCVVCAYVPVCISPVMTFAVVGKTLDVTTIFTSISYILLLCSPLAGLFQSIPGFLASFTCATRVQRFLESDSRVDFRGHSRPQDEVNKSEKAPGVSEDAPSLAISGGNFGWEAGKPWLKGVDLDIPASRLTMIVGPVASGKSTLCKALLGESPVADGSVVMSSGPSRRIGFCDQTPYLSNSTIRQNIIGFAAFDQIKYNEVLEATLLHPDLAALLQGDQTNIGSNGITLSGGQKQRVSMARALYLDANFLIFDDSLSGLDADTEEQVFRRVFSPEGLLRRRHATVVLCTHSVRHLPAADHIVALGLDGTIVEQGTFQELLANEQYVHSLGIKETDSSSTEGEEKPSALENPQASQPPPTAKTLVLEEDQGRMMGEWATYKHYFERIDKLSLYSFVIFGLGWGFFCNFVTIWLKFWSEDAMNPVPTHSHAFYIGLYGMFQVLALVSLFLICIISFITMVLGSGSKLHGEALGTVIRAPLKFFTTTDTGVVTNLFSQDMTLVDSELPMAVVNLALEIFNIAGMAAVIATASPFLTITYPFMAAILYLVQMFYLRTSRQIRLLDLEAKSPLYSHFIDTIKGVATFRAFGWMPESVALNNKLLDTSQRPAYLLAMIQQWLGFVLRVVVAVLAVAVVALSTQMRSNSAFTGASLITLMSFGNGLSSLIIFYTLLETSIGAVSRLKTFGEKVKPETLEGEDVIPPPEWPLMGRIQIKNVSASYGNADTSSEGEASSAENETKSNEDGAHLAIKNLTLDIKPGEKVALCGRSGSGKSSMVLLLLRLLDPCASSSQGITIDDLPLDKIDRATLRQRIIAVPQDAVFLPDGTTFQTNLDPYRISTAAECRAVLEAVGLWAFVDERGGLEAGMTADTLSQGQKQLFSLARAVLRRRLRARGREAEFGGKVGGQGGGVLLLDEVSSSVDQDTERAMQKVIRDEFEGYTVVMVSHRLEAVMGFDRVVVMAKGEVVEEGKPGELVEREGGVFRELWMVGGQ
ncbi:P-loop containing nucleoside triphosphate hydrolase protein [Podospora conica]|nr:P-loop containing nucleoside triphosphate hydrolase protein [Schizothecium conicum]